MLGSPQPDIVSLDQCRANRREYLPLSTRMELYDLVIGLARLGLSYRQIQDAVFDEKRVSLSKGAISEWARGIHKPLGRVNAFRSDPSPELAYVIGVVLGDGNLNVHGYSSEILLSVTNYDFAKEFSKCLARILVRQKPYKVRRSEKRNRWIVQGASVLLHRFLNRTYQVFKPWVEHNSERTASFLRALYDSEGSIGGRKLAISNTNLKLLFYVRDLLYKYDIETGKPHVTHRAGTILKDSRTGKLYRGKKDCYQLLVRTASLAQFARHIGFTIPRKRLLLQASAS